MIPSTILRALPVLGRCFFLGPEFDPLLASKRKLVSDLGKKMLRHASEIFNLVGKIAIVTGGSRGIGKEIAVGLAKTPPSF